MHRRYKLAIPIALIAITTVVVIAVIASLKCKKIIDNPVSTPRLLYSFDISPQHLESMRNVINVTQGTAVHVNLTLTSECDAQMEIPIEEVELIGYSENVTETWGGSSWDKPLIQENVFTYSLSHSKLILQPKESNSTIITISLADNTPQGRYTLDLHLGKIKFLSTPGEHDISYGGTYQLYLVVNSTG